MKRTRALLAALVVALACSVPGADAATDNGFGAWTFGGASTAYAGTMTLPGTGYPEATWTSTSRSGQVGVVSGASTWFGANSPPGERFGSSQDRPYVTLRPRVDASSPSVTTYTFARPAPEGWGFVLGDVDADQVQISATLADGSPAPVAALGFRSTFNLCGTTPRPSSCGAGDVDQPTWDPDTGTLTGNPGANDTFGASAWFAPTASLRTLTFTYTRRSGFPVYQTWFAATTRDVTGTVSVSDGVCDVTATTLHLLAPDDTEVATTQPAADGSYSFDQVAASSGFAVRIDGIQAGCEADGPVRRDVDLSDADAEADFAIRAEPGTGVVAGSVTEQETGDPVPDAVVEVVGTGVDESDTTGDDGTYAVPTVPPGDYTATITPPDGYEVVGSPSQEVTVPSGGGPVPGVDFVLAPVATPTPTPTATPTPTPSVSVSPVATPSASASAAPSAVATIPDTGGVARAWPLAGLALLLAGLTLVLVGRRIRRG